jgi:uncharacterized membrane protein
MHLYNTIALAQGHLVTIQPDKTQPIIVIPAKWTLENQSSIHANSVAGDALRTGIRNGNDGWRKQIRALDKDLGSTSIGLRNPYISIAWMPQALAWRVADYFAFSMKNSYILMRLANLIFYCIMLSICIAIIPHGKVAAMVLALNPYSICVASSLSSDTYTITLVSLFLSLIFKFCLQQGQSVKRQEKVMLTIFGILLFTGKVPYATVLLLIFALPKEQFSMREKMAAFFLSGLVGSALYIVWSHLFLHVTLPPWVDQAENVRLILDSPFKALTLVLANTLYPKDTMGWFMNTIASTSGWMFLPVVAVFVAGMRFMVYAKFGAREKFNIPLLLGALVAAFAAIALIHVFLLLTWTDVRTGFTTLSGFQGRYYLPLIFLLLLPWELINQPAQRYPSPQPYPRTSIRHGLFRATCI